MSSDGSEIRWYFPNKFPICSAFSLLTEQADQQSVQKFVYNDPVGSISSLFFLSVEDCSVSTFYSDYKNPRVNP